MRTVRLREEKLVISSSAPLEERCNQKPKEEAHRAFEKFAYDSLVVEGLVHGNQLRKDQGRIALRRLGLVDIHAVSRFGKKFRANQVGKLTLFAPNGNAALKLLYNYETPSGILLLYMAEFGLEVVGG